MCFCLPFLFLPLVLGIYCLKFGNILFLPIVFLCIECISVLKAVCWLTDVEFTSAFLQSLLWYLAVRLLLVRWNLVFHQRMRTWHRGSDIILPLDECLLEIWAFFRHAQQAESLGQCLVSTLEHVSRGDHFPSFAHITLHSLCSSAHGRSRLLLSTLLQT